MHMCSRDEVGRWHYLDGFPQSRRCTLGPNWHITQPGCGKLVDVEGRQAGYEARDRCCLSHKQLHMHHAIFRPLKESLQALC